MVGGARPTVHDGRMSDDVRGEVDAGRIAVRSSLRFGEWLVRGASGYFEVHIVVDDVTRLVPIGDAEATSLLSSRADGSAPTLVLSPRQRADVALKTDYSRYEEVLAAWTIGMQWGATSESPGGASYTLPAEVAAFHDERARRLTFALRFTRSGPPPADDRQVALLSAIDARRATVLVSLGREHGALVAAPASLAGQPYGLATFDGDRVARLHVPFGTVLVDALSRRLTVEDVALTPLSPAAARELDRKCRLDALEELLLVEEITLRAGFGALVTYRDPADAPALRAQRGEAFTYVVEFAVRGPQGC